MLFLLFSAREVVEKLTVGGKVTLSKASGSWEAAEQRAIVAHGVSRGFGLAEAFSPGRGERGVATRHGGRAQAPAPAGA